MHPLNPRSPLEKPILTSGCCSSPARAAQSLAVEVAGRHGARSVLHPPRGFPSRRFPIEGGVCHRGIGADEPQPFSTVATASAARADQKGRGASTSGGATAEDAGGACRRGGAGGARTKQARRGRVSP